MKSTSSARRPQPTSEHANAQAASTGRNGIALTPPAYGLDVVDRGLVNALQRPAENSEPLASIATQPAYRSFQSSATQAPVQRQGAPEEEELLQGELRPVQRQRPALVQGNLASASGAPAQLRHGAPNRTGMPDQLKAGLEQLSGLDLSRIRVHYNSAKPASLQALAYTQGQDIHVGPGQERHLPHEGWHAVQQRQGRVKPTMQAQGVSINDDRGLEQEAEVMGAQAMQMHRSEKSASEFRIHDHSDAEPRQFARSGVVQREVFVYTVPQAAAYHGAAVIANTRHVRTGHAGGNHFIAHSNIVTTVQDLIFGRTRNQSGAILAPLIQSPWLLPANVNFNTDTAHNYWLDYVISDIADDPRNIWAGVSNNPPNSTLTDMSPVAAERVDERGYHNWLHAQLPLAYVAAGKALPVPVANFMNHADGVLAAAGYP